MNISKVLLCLSLLISLNVGAQEFQMTVTVNTPNLLNVEKSVFDGLETKLNNFINNTAWTGSEYEDFEKIKGSINLTITKEESATSFSAQMDILARRPVYGSDYETTLINFRDPNVGFSYDQSSPINYNENSFNDNLSAIFAYYAFIVLGLDGDSFSLYGGDEYFDKARTIVQRIPNSLKSGDQSGWSQTGSSRNRARLIQEILDPGLRPVRKAMYDYHRLGLDMMQGDMTSGRNQIKAALHSMQEANSAEPNSMFINIFFLSKALELNEIFAVSQRAEKIEVFNMIRDMDAGNTQKYDKLIR